jgi:hypothetical protein
MNFGVTSLAAPNAASSRTARYSSTARPAASGGRPAVPLDAIAVAGVGLDQAGVDGKAFPADTRPSSMQRRSTLSNSRLSRSLSRKRPCRFFEKIERRQLSPQAVAFDKPVDRPQQVPGGYVGL